MLCICFHTQILNTLVDVLCKNSWIVDNNQHCINSQNMFMCGASIEIHDIWTNGLLFEGLNYAYGMLKRSKTATLWLSHGRPAFSVHLWLGNTWTWYGSLDLGLITSIQRHPEESSAYHNRPERVSSSRIEAEPSMWNRTWIAMQCYNYPSLSELSLFRYYDAWCRIITSVLMG